MPVQPYRPENERQAALDLISAYEAIADAKGDAENAEKEAAFRAQAASGLPPDVVEAYRVVAEGAKQDVFEAEKRYDNALRLFREVTAG